MKKRIAFAFALAVVGFGIFSAETFARCIDADGGRNYLDKGTTWNTSFSEVYADQCANDTTMVEHYCSSEGQIYSERISCPNGCNNGQCIQGGLIRSFGPTAAVVRNSNYTKPDLTVDNVRFNRQSLQARVCNQGGTFNARDLIVKFNANGIGYTWREVKTNYFASGECRIASVAINHNSHGNYTVEVEVDTNNKFKEVSEDNNYVTTNLDINSYAPTRFSLRKDPIYPTYFPHRSLALNPNKRIGSHLDPNKYYGPTVNVISAQPRPNLLNIEDYNYYPSIPVKRTYSRFLGY